MYYTPSCNVATQQLHGGKKKIQKKSIETQYIAVL